MTKSQIVAAIDIGTSKIVAIAGNKDEFGRIKVLGYGDAPSKGVVRGAVQNIGEVASAISEAVRKCRAMSDVQFRNVFVGMSGQNIRTVISTHNKYIASNQISKLEVDQLTNEVYNINMEPGEEIIHVIPQSYSVDGMNIGLSPVGFSGKMLEGRFLVIFGNANLSKAIKQAVVTAGLNIIKLIYKPIASSEAVLSSEDKEIGTLVADIGAGTTEVAIFHDKVLKATSSIPFGGNAIANDIKSACQIIWRQAELLKVKHASALPMAGDAKTVVSIKGMNGRTNKEVSLLDLATITNARMDEIVAGIAYVLDHSGCMNQVSEIVITGGSSKLKNISQFVKFRLGREVRIGKPRELSEEGIRLGDVEHSTINGLLIKGFEYSEQASQMKAAESEARPKQSADEKPEKDSKQKPSDDKSGKPGSKKMSFFDKVKHMASTFFNDGDDTSQKM